MAASTVFFVCFASSPPNVSSRSTTNELAGSSYITLCHKKKKAEKKTCSFCQDFVLCRSLSHGESCGFQNTCSFGITPQLIGELCSKRKSWSRGSSQAATSIGFTCFANLRMRLYSLQYPELKMLTSNGSSRGKYPVVQRHSDYLKTCTRNHSGSSSRYVTDYPDINKVISGYWVGPDVEDGWGYAEAIVDQVF